MPVPFSIETIINGGSSDTEQNAETVMPNNFPLASADVTTVTPLANLERVFLNMSGLTLMRAIFPYGKTDASATDSTEFESFEVSGLNNVSIK